MRAFWIGLVVLLACKDPVADTPATVADTPATLVGNWQIKQPTGFTDFRLTLAQGVGSAMTGDATSSPTVCRVFGMPGTVQGGTPYDCGVIVPVIGNRAADTATLNLGQYPDGASINLILRLVGKGAIGDLTFRDPSGVTHPIGTTCIYGPGVCLDSPGPLEFTRGGAAVASIARP